MGPSCRGCSKETAQQWSELRTAGQECLQAGYAGKARLDLVRRLPLHTLGKEGSDSAVRMTTSNWLLLTAIQHESGRGISVLSRFCLQCIHGGGCAAQGKSGRGGAEAQGRGELLCTRHIYCSIALSTQKHEHYRTVCDDVGPLLSFCPFTAHCRPKALVAILYLHRIRRMMHATCLHAMN